MALRSAAVAILAVLAGCGAPSPPREREAETTRRATKREKASGREAAREPASDARGPRREPPPRSAPAAVARSIVASEAARPSGDPFERARRCRDARGIAVTVSPRRPTSADRMRVIVTADEPLDDVMVVARGPDGIVALPQSHWGGPPYAWSGAIAQPAEGEWEVGIARAGELVACRWALVRRGSIGLGGGPSYWTAERGWDRATENLYSAWIEHLFDAPDDARVAWRPLHELTRDRERNLLWNHLGLGEDDPATPGAITLPADCADVPYFLRAYFAWKLRLPFQWSRCAADSGWRAPVCTERFDNTLPRPERAELAAFQALVATLADTVHSGNMRALPTDELADFYSVTLTRDSLRPGTVFANPWGHVLVVSRWRPQDGDRPGALYAVDGNPDRSIGRKRFWRGAFAFGTPVWAGAAGFKAFRPIVARDGGFHALTNREINGHAAYGNYSHEQYRGGAEEFYAKVERLIDPTPLPPERAFDQTFDALLDMLAARVRAVALGVEWANAHPDEIVPMPDGPEIFETLGPWEEWATPSRDLTLLGALDLVESMPAAVEAHPERFGVAPGAAAREARRELEARLARRAAEASITYRRSDGADQRLTVRELLARKEALEVAYDPNDCIEVRWGAPEGSDEAASCARRAPAEQTARMAEYRPWFHERTRPRRIR